MPEIPKQTIAEAAQLNRLMPRLAQDERVEASVQHAISHGFEKVGTNSEKKIGAHILRLENLLARDGVEERVWKAAVNEMIIDNEAIPEAYWGQQEQRARDEGQGDIRIGLQERRALTEQIQDAQRTGLESWSKYFESIEDQYPVWFKFYAWDGMSKMSTFDKTKSMYGRRSSGTVAPYPELNAAALAKVYELVSVEENTTNRTADIQKLIQNSNFNKLYSQALLEQKVIMPTPERPEDVEGEWKEYTAEHINEITEASSGTPWCIAGEGMAKQYTKGGGKFILFHLRDPETGLLSPTACASIRLDPDGKVVEVSGLKGGSNQYLEDALVPAVEDKLRTQKGGEEYLEAFEDKRKLIEMDKKFQAGEPFTVEEILFLYENDRQIKYFDTYARDPRPEQFKKDKDEHVKILAEVMGENVARTLLVSGDEIRHNPSRWIKAGYDAKTIAKRLSPRQKLKYFQDLQAAGASLMVDEIADKLTDFHQAVYVESLRAAGYSRDINELIPSFVRVADGHQIADFIKAGADVSLVFDEIFKNETQPGKKVILNAKSFLAGGMSDQEFMDSVLARITPNQFTRILDGRNGMDRFIDAGVNPELVAKYIGQENYLYFDTFVERGVDPRVLLDVNTSYFVAKEFGTYVKLGIPIDEILAHIDAEDRFREIDKLNKAGAELDTQEVFDSLRPIDKVRSLGDAKDRNLNFNAQEIIETVTGDEVALVYAFSLLEGGADPRMVANKVNLGRDVYIIESDLRRYSYDGRLARIPQEFTSRLYERIQVRRREEQDTRQEQMQVG